MAKIGFHAFEEFYPLKLNIINLQLKVLISICVKDEGFHKIFLSSYQIMVLYIFKKLINSDYCVEY